MKIDEFKGSLPDVVNGLPPQPEVEEATGHASTAGEESSLALEKSSDDAAFVLTGKGPLSASVEMVDITRATMRCAVEPWRIAEDVEAHKKRTCAGKKSCSACQLISALYKAQTEVAGAMNLVARELYAVDAALLDAFRIKHGRGPKGKELEFCSWKGDGTGYQRVRKAYPELLSGIAAALTREVTVKWMKDRWSVLVKCEKGPAFYRDSAPIPLRAADCKLVETDVRDVFHLGFSLTSGRIGSRGKEFVLPIRCKDQKQYNALHRIAAGTDRMGQIEIARDSRSDKWFLRVAYKRRVAMVSGGKAAAINRGIVCILAAVVSSGESTLEDGVAIEKHLAQLTRRRHEFQNAWRLSSRKGRGRVHTLAPLKALEDAGERWRKTRLQEIARQTAKWLQARGVTRVYFDDFKDIRNSDVKLLDGGKPVWDRIQRWPYFQMGTRLRACLQEYGIGVIVVDPQRNSLTCPVCKHVQDGPVTSRKWKCPKCGHRDHTDLIFCKNSLAKGEHLRAAKLAGAESPEDPT
jgi:IS605 OrfB family transposase